ncbi:MAG: PadR family transcriptional regulator [Planctomycetota bacterium]
MAHQRDDLLRGTLDLLVLKSLQSGPRHGYGIARRIQESSGDVLQVEEGSLYPALHRMEKRGWIAAEWGVSEANRRAKFYRLTDAGRGQLAESEASWARMSDAIARVLRAPMTEAPGWR